MLLKGTRVLVLRGEFQGMKGSIEEVQVGFYFGTRYTIKMDNGKVRIFLQGDVQSIYD